MNQLKPMQGIIKCLNCGTATEVQDAFCSNCGQRTRKSRLSLWFFVSDFFGTFFNLDSRLFQTIRKIVFPARLASDYMRGKRKSYINPSRFFFFCLIIHFAALAYLINHTELGDTIDKFKQDSLAKLNRSEMAIEFDSLVMRKTTADSDLIAEIRDSLFKDIGSQGRDTFELLQQFQVNSQISLSKYSISTKDFMYLNSKQLETKYKIEDFWERSLLRQIKKMWSDPYGTIQYVVSNFLWVIVLQVLFSALFLKLIYIRRPYYYVEHLIISMSYHSVVLLLLTITYLSIGLNSGGQIMFKLGNFLPRLSTLAAVLYVFFSLKNFYKQSYFKTFFKFCLLCFCELILVITFASIILLISMFIF